MSIRPSHAENGRGYFLTGDDIEWFSGHYLADPALGTDPRVSPLLAEDLSRLPPAVVATAQFDPLRDDGAAYAEALAAAGVRVIHRCFEGLVHGFLGFGPFSKTATAAISQLCTDLRTMLAPDTDS